MFMKFLPANVDRTFWSRKFLRDWTSGASSEPYAAEAMMHGRTGKNAVVTVAVVVSVIVGETDVVVVVVVDVVVVVYPVDVTEVNVTVGE